MKLLNLQSINQITKLVCQNFNITEKELRSKKRTQNNVKARTCYSVMLMRYMGAGVTDIASFINRHYSCIIHYRSLYNQYYEYDTDYKQKVDIIEDILYDLYKIHPIKINSYTKSKPIKIKNYEPRRTTSWRAIQTGMANVGR